MEQVRLIEPDGTENIIVSMDYAINYCRQYSGWSWRYLSPDEINSLV